jgi:anthranilate phosphoribosyltransferase
MNELFHKVLQNHSLIEDDCEMLIDAIDKDLINEYQLAGILTTLHLRGEKLSEISGFRSALLKRSVVPELDGSDAIDMCGTGGDGKNTFNISTTSSFVMAAMGYKVIKHGNYGVSSSCGSSTVVEALGLKLTADQKELQKDLSNKNLCFLHAPLFHPTMKKVGQLRQKLGIRTIFNSLGPLVNPVQPAYQQTGTFSLELARSYAYVLRSERKRFIVFHGMNGYDELTLCDTTRAIGSQEDRILEPKDYLLPKILPDSIHSASTPHENASLIRSILKGEGSEEQTNVIAANVTEAQLLYHPRSNREEIFRETKKYIRSGYAAKHFKLS